MELNPNIIEVSEIRPVDEARADVAEAYDAEDVPAALARETQDGPGFESEDELPESDFIGFATEDVEGDE